MTTEPSKEAIFKQRLIAVIADLQAEGRTDPEAVLLIGSLASDLADKLKQKNWVAVKQAMSAAQYNELLGSFQNGGNQLHQDGKAKQAFAVQLLGVSLVAATQRNDADVAAGEKLVDQFIDRAIVVYRQSRPRH
ncbi:hypothetical protein [Devosia sediminis]|uniref:Uncharacterized protein n=1 Tax=Devosia sediminis TaxID=2798801 RepID=A0A934MK23_9HYPH|nr:hypothetical protein [Devosia sediminis]MBJ3783690.1 hypothetical protein [Devosia sediminis]